MPVSRPEVIVRKFEIAGIRLFGFQDQVGHGCFTDIQDFVPLDARTAEMAVGRQFDIAGAVRVGDPHPSAGKRVAEMGRMKMPLMPDSGRKRATQCALLLVFKQIFADRLVLPASGQRVRQFSATGAGCEERRSAQSGVAEYDRVSHCAGLLWAVIRR